MSKIKVINVISDTNIGGAGVMLLTLAAKYDRDSFEIVTVVPTGSKLVGRLAKLSVRYIETDGIADESFSIKAVSCLLKIFREEKPQIVHTHATLSARIAARLYGAKGVVNTRHSVFDVKKWKTFFPVKQLSGIINSALSDAIIAVSPAAKNNIIAEGVYESKISVIYNGVAQQKQMTAEEIVAERAALGLSPTDFVCAIIGRLEKIKGHEYVLDAAKYLQSRDEDIKVLIAGTGSEQSALESQAKQLGLRNCILMGFVDDIYKVENIMDVQLNMSYGTEATSLSLLEGMSLGKPAIVTDFGGNPYVIEHGTNGLVIPKKDSNDLYGAILSLKLDKDLYSSLSANAKKIYETKFTDVRMVRGIEKIYRELLT
ncbi:MAG: glycosyltransferase [Clostridiales bacterium]|jgi:glycosyltransferase involved in cell wall biosynthesis|nr:glycosyltransferase [Clostridiales bacterium]